MLNYVEQVTRGREEEKMTETERLIGLEDAYGARIYSTLPIVFKEANGAILTDVEGIEYIDAYSAYSANISHRDPRLICAVMGQYMTGLALTARCVHHNRLGPWMERVCKLTGMDRVIPKNGGVEADEAAWKAMLRYGVRKMGIENGNQRIVVMKGAFSGRTLTALSAMDNEKYRKDFGPMSPVFVPVEFGNLIALIHALRDENVVGVFMEPWLGEGGVIPAPRGYLVAVVKEAHKMGKIVVFDEIQTGLGRTGKLFAWQHDGGKAKPDGICLGKALSGGMFPMSAFLGTEDLMSVFDPGSDGSTYGGNPVACAASMAALDIIEQDDLVEKSRDMGERALNFFRTNLEQIPGVVDIRGGGLFIGIQLDRPVAPVCEMLLQKYHVVCLDTHKDVLRFAPPLCITEYQFQKVISKIVEAIETFLA